MRGPAAQRSDSSPTSAMAASDCRRHNNNNRLDTRAIQKWIDDTVKAKREK